MTDEGETSCTTSAGSADTSLPTNTVNTMTVDDRDVAGAAVAVDKATSQLPEKPFHPKQAKLSHLNLRQKLLHFQESWFTRFKWLHYETELQGVLCHVCASMSLKGQLHLAKNTEAAFTVAGFRTWKKAIERFTEHENSHCHRQAALQLAQMESSQPVCALISKQKAEEQEVGRRCLLRIFTSAQYLLRQGLAFRRCDDTEGNFRRLLLLRSEDVPELKYWLSKRIDFTSWNIQNEMLDMFSHNMLRHLC